MPSKPIWMLDVTKHYGNKCLCYAVVNYIVNISELLILRNATGTNVYNRGEGL